MNGWSLVYETWDAEQQPRREALCALGNGHFVTRGAAEETSAGGPHYPGTYLAGGYNRATTRISGRDIENEDLVNWPNWLPLTFRIEGGPWFDLGEVELLDFRQELNLLEGTLQRRLRFRDRDNRETFLDSERLVHMEYPNIAALRWCVEPVNWSGSLEVRSGLDGNIRNEGVARYRELESEHLDVIGVEEVSADVIDVFVRTKQSQIALAQAARTRFWIDDAGVVPPRASAQDRGWIAQTARLDVEQGQRLRVEKIVGLHTSRDHAISHPRHDARRAADYAGSYDELRATHARAWKRLWHRCAIVLNGDAETQSILHLHIFHLLQTVSMNTIGRDVGVPSRGWHGEAYRGHIFWDELFIFPFLTMRLPELTRELLLYRYRRLDEARRHAAEHGYRGAMFPWQSGSNGREESQVLHLNPESGNWVPDNTHLQRHVNAAIAYNVWQAYEATGDMDFLEWYGAELLLELARFWASIAEWNEGLQRYEIAKVVGPDEYHTRLPDSDEPGLRNNAYTNVMAAWVLERSLHMLELLADDRRDELLNDLSISEQELHRWDEISRKLRVCFHGEGIISQFEGYERLEELYWEKYRAEHGESFRLDRILEAEGDDVNRYKAGKQADVLMLFFLLRREEVERLFHRLGYEFTREQIPRNIEYYLQRSSHGSTLSYVADSWVLSRSHRKQAWRYFQNALRSDIDDIQGGTTPEGIHLGAMAGTVDFVQRAFTGVAVQGDVLRFNPRLPDALGKLDARVRYRGQWLSLSLTHESLRIAFEKGGGEPVRVAVGDEEVRMERGDTREFSLSQ